MAMMRRPAMPTDPSLPSAMNREDRSDPASAVIGYMDLTDFECELGAARGGNRVYPSIEDCRENNPCNDECGIVEVEVRARRIVQASNMPLQRGEAGDADEREV
jgi:hypothetical protein